MNSLAKGLLILSFIGSLSAVDKVHAIAGKIVYSYGQVEATSADGAIRPLTRGDVIESGESVRTVNGRTQIRFTDGGFVALQPNTQYRLEDYNFEGTVDGSEKSFFYLVEGSIRLVTGLIGRSNKENFQLTTPVASIGIRGTSGKCWELSTLECLNKKHVKFGHGLDFLKLLQGKSRRKRGTSTNKQQHL